MAKHTTNANNKVPPKPQPFFIQAIFLPWTVTKKLVGGLLIAILLSIIIEWLGMWLWWDLDHSKTMFLSEYNVIKNDFSFSMLGSPPISLINYVLTSVIDWFKQTWLMQYLFSPITGNELGILGFIKSIVAVAMAYFTAVGYVILTALMRLLIFFLSLPWFGLCALVGLVDGLIEREVRKYEGGIEHAWIYHSAKSHLPLGITVAWVVYLGLPFAVHPSIILIPAGIAFGINLYITAWSFKKFL